MRLQLIALLSFVTVSTYAAAPAITLDYPRGGEVFVIGTNQRVTLSQKVKAKSVKVELSRDGGANFELLGTITIDKKQIPTLAFAVSGNPSNTNVIRVSDAAKPTVFAQSAPFAIAASVGAGNLVIPDGFVVTPQLADGSVTNPKLAPLAVTSDKVSSGQSSVNFVLTADGSGNANWTALPATGTAVNFTGPLLGDVTGTQNATVVSQIAGVSAGNIASGANLALAATNQNTASLIVRRDANGDFAAGNVFANLTGNVTGNVSGTSLAFTGNLAGNVTGPQGATRVDRIGNLAADEVVVGIELANAATETNTADTIVKRDANGNFSAGTITANLIGNVTGNVSGTAGSTTSFSGNLAGDVIGTQGATVVALIGGLAADEVAVGAELANAATETNTPDTIVKRDANGNFSAGTITANLIGNVAGSIASAVSFTGNLAGDVTGTQSATVVSQVGGATAANVAVGASLANAATNANTANTIVKRDASGNFSAGTITGNLTGNVTGTAANVTGIVAVDHGGTGQTSYTNGQLLIGNTTGNTLTKGTLGGTANQINVTNGAGSITLSTPQDIAATSSPTFAILNATSSVVTPVVNSTAAQLDFNLSGTRAMRLIPAAAPATDAPGILAGKSTNSITAGVKGATIAGGGGGTLGAVPLAGNSVTDDYGTISGGTANVAGDGSGIFANPYATVGGGIFNTATGSLSTVAGGGANSASVTGSAIAGGQGNQASGLNATVGGGTSNTASGSAATVAGGNSNTAAGDASFAAGSNVSILAAHSGTFLFADSNISDFNSAAANEFAVRATGGVRFVTAISGSTPTKTFSIGPTGNAVLQGDLTVEGSLLGNFTLPVNRGGTGQTTYTNGQLLIGNTTGNTLTKATLTGTTNQVLVTNGNGSITLSTPQNIGTSSTPTFASVTASVAVTAPLINSLGSQFDVQLNGNRALRLIPSALPATDGPSIIAGFKNNAVFAGAMGATISGGGGNPGPNTVFDNYGTIAGGAGNEAGTDDANVSIQFGATVGGGTSNTARSNLATISGGDSNDAFGPGASIGGGADNSAGGIASVIGGGQLNDAFGLFAVIGGGSGNNASEDFSAIGGGSDNAASGVVSTIGGGEDNTAIGGHSTVSGGEGNAASGNYSAIGGGRSNVANSGHATVSGGLSNQASSSLASVGGGDSNRASGANSTVSGGTGNIASGLSSMIPGGALNTAAGDYSLAAGRRAKVDSVHEGVFMFSDQSNFDFNSATDNEFAVRATGGIRFVTAIDGTGAATQTFRIDATGDAYVQGDVHVDGTSSNGGTVHPGLTFGDTSSAETISSNRTTGTVDSSLNRFGMDFYCNGIRRMALTNSGNLGIGAAPGTSSLLELTSTTKALVLSRMTKVQRDAIATKIAGMAVYQTDNTPGLRVYNGTNWVKFTETND